MKKKKLCKNGKNSLDPQSSADADYDHLLVSSATVVVLNPRNQLAVWDFCLLCLDVLAFFE